MLQLRGAILLHSINGRSTIYAYQVGYNARIASPYTTPLLAFGRQLNDASQGWGIVLVGVTNGYRSNTWVKAVAEAFINGFTDSARAAGRRTVSSVIIGTNNSNYPWTCDNTNASTLSPNWRAAGIAWGGLIKNLVSTNWVDRASGNDIESWQGTFSDGWTACGLGGIEWYNGYESQVGYVPNYNFGTNGYAENASQWTQRDVYQVMASKTTALARPQIYCSGQPPTWVAMMSVNGAGGFSFWGVTSENAFSTICGTRSYTWLQSWNALNNALTSGGYPDRVERSVSSFYYP